MLEAQKLTKRFQDRVAVDSLDLRIEPGEIYALLGPNGAGKTTTINLFLGFLTPDSGAARVAGTSVAEDPVAARRKLAYIPEMVSLYPRFSGVENLDYFSRLGGHARQHTELYELLARSGLTREAADRRVGTYSKGMRQKVGIALALATGAKALLLDEPTSGLDPAASHEFSRMLRKLAKDGVAILMATHDLFRAREDASRIGIILNGRLVAQYSRDEIKDQDLEKIYLERLSA
ncbi:MAG: ABC transporter ATP-binding protein [Planctomycetota bacterium]|nr:ABC transporter ATP-binding protein [Planctomycetota bacterium]